jgi:hypothetical protein
MNEAVVVFSRKGLFKTEIKARDVRSREHARKLWPLVAPDTGRQMLTWVSPSFEGGKLRRRSHFRRLPATAGYDLQSRFDEEEAARWHATQESPAHRRAKELIASELSRRLAAGLALPWSFKDPEASDYALEGNLLLGADRIAVEMPLKTPFGSGFRLDVAVVGPPVEKTQVLLGGVEIEMAHAFDGRKALIGKSLGFPLMSIDIADMSLDEITPDWARGALSATTRSNEQGRRQTYVYLHDLLYPLHAQLPAYLDDEQRHQFLIFSDDDTLHKLVRWFNRLSRALNYANGAIAIALVNGKSEQSRKMLERAGAVAGPDWHLFNDHQCLRLTAPRSKGVADLQAHRFHMTLARLLLSHANALVGYKYCNGVDNNHPEEDIWIAHRWIADQGIHTKHRVLPKRLAEPLNRMMRIVGELQHARNSDPRKRPETQQRVD